MAEHENPRTARRPATEDLRITCRVGGASQPRRLGAENPWSLTTTADVPPAIAPHARNLRRGRIHRSGVIFSVTTVVLGRRKVLGPAESGCVVDALQWLRRERRIRLYAFVVMPDHVHAILEPLCGWSIEAVMKTWKQHAARAIHDLHRCRGTLWQEGFFDHALRSMADAHEQFRYLAENPVRKGLARVPAEYPYSSFNPRMEPLVDPFRG